MLLTDTEIQTDIRRLKAQLQEIENKLYLLTVQKEEEVTVKSDGVPWETVRDGFEDRARANIASLILWTEVIDSDVGIDSHQRFRVARTYGLIRPIKREEVHEKIGLNRQIDVGKELGLDQLTYRIADILEDRGDLEKIIGMLVNLHGIVEYGYMYYDVSACNVSASLIAKRIERDSSC
jgi:hypothetical protein